ncbi:MAG: hypothetical protein IJ139_01045 [Bacteroidaceae bacterium]|jgi:hypothetical protein|nr:hypothetical protein [Bacteroidaceae bacterium]MBR1378402.1 hypothetical protein [Bacteroidaceae bacterium]
MKKLFLFGLAVVAPMLSWCQDFRGHFINEELKVKLELNADSATIGVPGLPDEFCYGYLQGNLNGTWIILKVVKRKENKLTVRAVCDNGSDAQTLELTLDEKGGLSMRQIDDALIKTIEGKKYVKLPKVVAFHR